MIDSVYFKGDGVELHNEDDLKMHNVCRKSPITYSENCF